MEEHTALKVLDSLVANLQVSDSHSVGCVSNALEPADVQPFVCVREFNLL